MITNLRIDPRVSASPVKTRPHGPDHVMDVLREAIVDSHMTQKQMAIRCDLSLSAVQGIASGRTRWPRPTTFVTLCLLLNLELTLRRR
jgi:transcriptional regulator with XRE-family HTH domain